MGTSTGLVTWFIFSWMMGFFLCNRQLLVDLLLDDGLLSLHCQLSVFRLLHFNCVDDGVERARSQAVASFLASE